MAKKTDLLKDPVALAQQRYQEQVNAFKDEFIPKPSNRGRNKFLIEHNQNIRYEKKYGFIFIVCATGKSATQMLEILNSRMNHSYEQELQIASQEQAKITHLRLEKI